MTKHYTISFFFLFIFLFFLVTCGDTSTPPKAHKEVSFSFISPHSIVADITAENHINGVATLVITENKDKPTPPSIESIYDGFINRKLIKLATRHVYMAQNYRVFNTNDNIGTHNNAASLHPAFLKANSNYYLHLLYTKQGTTNLTHKYFPFKTLAFNQLGSDGEKPTSSFSATPNQAINVIEWRKDKENFFIGWGLNINNPLYAIFYKFADDTEASKCNPTLSGKALSCSSHSDSGVKVILFEKVKDDSFGMMWTFFPAKNIFYGAENPRDTTISYNKNTIVQKVLIITE